MEYKNNDGGRSQYFKGGAGDCVCRALVIASSLDYKEVYDFLANGNATQRITKNTRKSLAGKKTAAKGIYTKRKWFKDYMQSLGFEYEAYAAIGKPSRIKLDETFPSQGTYIASIGRHYVAVIDGVLQDTYDSREGRAWIDFDGVQIDPKPRMVYGAWKKK